jgi:hypothetical protein
VGLAVPSLHALLEAVAHVVGTVSAPGATPPPVAMSTEAEDAWQDEATEEGEGSEPRIAGGHTHGDGTPHCNEPEKCPGWTYVHGDLLVTPVDTSTTIASSCEDGVNAVGRSLSLRNEQQGGNISATRLRSRVLRYAAR